MTGVRLRVISPGYTGFSAQYVDALLRLRRICGEREIAFQWSGIQHLADGIQHPADGIQHSVHELAARFSAERLCKPCGDV